LTIKASKPAQWKVNNIQSW